MTEQPSRRSSPTATGCEWCGVPMPGKRADARTCSKRCRQALWRFRGQIGVARVLDRRLRLAYADPPYPGLSRRYYEDHPDYAGEVDLVALVSHLQQFDGWALSTSARALPDVLGVVRTVASTWSTESVAAAGHDDNCRPSTSDICRPAPAPPDTSIRVAAWVRGSRPGKSLLPRTAWEPVVYRPGRPDVSLAATDDALVFTPRPRLTDPRRVTGAKPAAFCDWLFRLLGAAQGDTLDDLYPGSGGVGRAWDLFQDPSRLQGRRLEPRR